MLKVLDQLTGESDTEEKWRGVLPKYRRLPSASPAVNGTSLTVARMFLLDYGPFGLAALSRQNHGLFPKTCNTRLSKADYLNCLFLSCWYSGHQTQIMQETGMHAHPHSLALFTQSDLSA